MTTRFDDIYKRVNNVYHDFNQLDQSEIKQPELSKPHSGKPLIFGIGRSLILGICFGLSPSLSNIPLIGSFLRFFLNMIGFGIIAKAGYYLYDEMEKYQCFDKEGLLLIAFAVSTRYFLPFSIGYLFSSGILYAIFAIVICCTLYSTRKI